MSSRETLFKTKTHISPRVKMQNIIEDHGMNGWTGPDTEDEMSVYDVG